MSDFSVLIETFIREKQKGKSIGFLCRKLVGFGVQASFADFGCNACVEVHA